MNMPEQQYQPKFWWEKSGLGWRITTGVVIVLDQDGYGDSFRLLIDLCWCMPRSSKLINTI